MVNFPFKATLDNVEFSGLRYFSVILVQQVYAEDTK